MYQRILVAIDGSATARIALEHAARLAYEQVAALRILHVLDVGDPLEGTAPVRLAEAGRPEGVKLLAAARAAATALGATVEDARMVDATGHRLGDVIASEAREFRADLLVLGSHGRRGAKRWMLGSVAESAARAATMPTLIVHPPA